MGIIARRQTWHNGHDLHERKVSASSWINDKVLQQYGRVCDQNSAHITFDAKSTGAGKPRTLGKIAEDEAAPSTSLECGDIMQLVGKTSGAPFKTTKMLVEFCCQQQQIIEGMKKNASTTLHAQRQIKSQHHWCSGEESDDILHIGGGGNVEDELLDAELLSCEKAQSFGKKFKRFVKKIKRSVKNCFKPKSTNGRNGKASKESQFVNELLLECSNLTAEIANQQLAHSKLLFSLDQMNLKLLSSENKACQLALELLAHDKF